MALTQFFCVRLNGATEGAEGCTCGLRAAIGSRSKDASAALHASLIDEVRNALAVGARNRFFEGHGERCAS
jgi:hypothetical protein